MFGATWLVPLLCELQTACKAKPEKAEVKNGHFNPYNTTFALLWVRNNLLRNSNLQKVALNRKTHPNS
jgi:hypothetical protein